MTTIACKGFKATGLHSGLKENRDKDLGLIYSETPATVAGVFTQNKIKAAPVLLDQERIAGGMARAVIVNSGNANCCNGNQGYRHALETTAAVAQLLGVPEKEVLVSSTGVIGQKLPIDKITAAAPDLVKTLKTDGFLDFAQAIMTTDTVPKIQHLQGQENGRPYHLVGIAKGSGMIAPNMATMLCYICSDVSMPQSLLQKLLSTTVDATLNRICIDGDTSTNDTTLLLSNGCSGVTLDRMDQAAGFQNLLEQLLGSLAKQLVKDGEGTTKSVEIIVAGASSDLDARTIADTVARSPLVKTALFGMDANWGRIIAAAGRAGVPVDPDHIDIYFNQVQMTRNSMGCGENAESQASQVLREPEFSITIDLNMGPGRASVLTCDFSVEYVKINADYRS